MHSDLSFGYCTNVHAGTTLPAAKENLLKFAAPVRQMVAPEGDLPVGLWLAQDAAEALSNPNQAIEFGQWLRANNFRPYTFNGFPQRNFHQPVVKHAVYSPTWLEDSRLRYTCQLVDLLSTLLPPASTGTISTLPLGWPAPQFSGDDFTHAASQLIQAAHHCRQAADRTGVEIVLAIEPEPGCVLNTAQEVVDFFEQFLFAGDDEAVARQHLSVCHDICHSGVMFEPQSAALQSYVDANIRIGKVQVSSAVHVPWEKNRDDPQEQSRVLAQLQTFHEPKFLHQATRCDTDGKCVELAEDLDVALANWIDAGSFPSSDWRVHFHVPIFVDRFDALETTQGDIARAVRFLHDRQSHKVGSRPWFTGHYEVETYAWTVLPEDCQETDLSTGIAREIEHFRNLMSQAAATHET